MRGCDLRHLNTDQYVVEVLAALREKFMIPHNEMFQDNSQSNSFSGGRQDGGRFGKQQQENDDFRRQMSGDDRFGNDQLNRMSQGGDSFGMRRDSDSFGMRQGSIRNSFEGNDFEPESKRMRNTDYNLDGNMRDGNMRSRFDDNRRGFSQGMDASSQPREMGNDPLDDLRQQNIKITEANKGVRKTAQMLEIQNEELRKALRLALDLNVHARSLQEFRSHLQEIQATLRKRGCGVDDASGAGSRNDLPMDRVSCY